MMIGKINKTTLFQILCGYFLLVYGCTYNSEHPGFSRTRSGIYYKLNIPGEGVHNPSPGDYLTVDLRYSTVHDSVFFSARRKFKLEEPAYRGSVEECFAMMYKGDDVDFIINANDFFSKTLEIDIPRFLEETNKLKISVRLIDLQTEQSYMDETRAFLSWIDDFGDYEKVRLRNFIHSENITAELDETGLYFINVANGDGNIINYGDTIEIHYEGWFMNGKFFDSTRKRNESFVFVYGQEFQLLEGLEKALSQMREGGKSLVILPSDLAFGSHGSSTGIIPPYTPVIYEVEVLSVR